MSEQVAKVDRFEFERLLRRLGFSNVRLSFGSRDVRVCWEGKQETIDYIEPIALDERIEVSGADFLELMKLPHGNTSEDQYISFEIWHNDFGRHVSANVLVPFEIRVAGPKTIR